MINFDDYYRLAENVNQIVHEQGDVDLIPPGLEHDGWNLQKQSYMGPNVGKSIVGTLSTFWTKGMIRVRIYTWNHVGVCFSGFNYNDQWYIVGHPLNLAPNVKTTEP